MNDFITYPQQLELPEWKEKRESILKRDCYRCSRCGHSPSLFKLGDKYVGYDKNCMVVDNNNIQHITNISYDEFKRIFNCTRIEVKWVRPSKEEIGQNNYGPVAMSDNGLLILMPISFEEIELYEEDPERISMLNRISIVTLRSGESYIVLTPHHFDLSSLTVKIPYISEYQIRLNVHHRYYIFSAKAWQYPDSALVTLCEHCHMIEHQQTQIKVYSYDAYNNMIDMKLTPCDRCHGAGYFPQWNHVEHGVCFKCNGTRYKELI